MNTAQFLYSALLAKTPLRPLVDALILKFLPATVRVGPATIFINPTDPIVSGALMMKMYENAEVAFFQKSCAPGMVFVDVGANVGLYSGLAAHLTDPHGIIVASDNNAKAQLFVNDKNKGDHRLYDGGTHDRISSVQTQTLDTLLGELGLSGINYLKVDVQGFEVKVICGAARILENSTQMLALIEFWPKGIRAAGDDPLELLHKLEEHHFSLYDLRQRTAVSLARADFPRLVERYHDHKYTNLIGIKGYNPEEFLAQVLPTL